MLKRKIKSTGEFWRETENTTKEQLKIARMRFGIIAPLIQEIYTDVSMAAYCRRVAQTPMTLPDGT